MDGFEFILSSRGSIIRSSICRVRFIKVQCRRFSICRVPRTMGALLSRTSAKLQGFLRWAWRVLAHKPEKSVDLTAATELLQGTSTDELMADAREKLGMDVRNHFNFAVVGQSGVGKSSLINAFRLLRDSHPDAAPVGETETTSKIMSYAHPAHPHIVLWDLPGSGTVLQPESTYFEDNMLYAFDCILVLSSNRFMKIDYEIAKKANQYRRPCAFVRTKADQSLKAIAERKGKTMREASKDLRLLVDESFQKGLKEAGFSALTHFHLFIVSGWAFTKGDAYILHDAETGEPDMSLDMMDEDQLVVFITNAARSRLPRGGRGGDE